MRKKPKFKTTLTKRVAVDLQKRGLSDVNIGARVRPAWEFYETESGEIAAWDRNSKSRFVGTGLAWKGGKTALRKAMKLLDVAYRFVENV